VEVGVVKNFLIRQLTGYDVPYHAFHVIFLGLSQPEKPVGNLLVVVNPKSGSAKGLQTFYKYVAPELYLKNIRYELVITSMQNFLY
jgi:hypothetical protein